MPRFQTLQAWLDWQQQIHPQAIDLGLARVQQVYQRLGSPRPAPQVITVAGTNGKGSTVAVLQSIFQHAGYRVGSYTTPHLHQYNERIRLQGQPVSDAALIDAFERIDQARAEISITLFEFGTLAALLLLAEADLDVALLEVGLGGRLDAVNIVAADLAIITKIDLDHQQWLGNDRETIGREKAGILRTDKPAVCSDPVMPASISAVAQDLGTDLWQLGNDFAWELLDDASWELRIQAQTITLPLLKNPLPSQLDNIAGAVTGLTRLHTVLPVSPKAIAQAIVSYSVPGRLQQHPHFAQVWVDVAHNPASCQVLKGWIQSQREQRPGKWIAVCGMLADKAIIESLALLQTAIDEWCLVQLAAPRASDMQTAFTYLQAQGALVNEPQPAAVIFRELFGKIPAESNIIVFGSFHTVALALSHTVQES